jgi:hypothetical protein
MLSLPRLIGKSKMASYATSKELEAHYIKIVVSTFIMTITGTPVFAQTCTPTDQYGMQCLSQVDSSSKINNTTGAVNYTITFENRCDRAIGVTAESASGTKHGNSVGAGGKMTLNCVNCGGFVSWYARCYNN